VGENEIKINRSVNHLSSGLAGHRDKRRYAGVSGKYIQANVTAIKEDAAATT
jgi:hypothetical protein